MKKAHLHTNSRLALSSSKGFSLVEMLVAMSVFLVFVLATTGVITTTSKTARHVSNTERATILAEESIEATRNLRDSDFGFNNLPDGTYGLSTTSNQWNLSGSSDTSGIFTRSVTISTINGSQKKVVVTVSWADQVSGSNSITSNTYLTNWRAPLSIGLTIDKSVINHGGTKVPSDFLPVNLTTLAWDYTVDPPVQNSVNIPIVFSPSTMTLGPGTYTFSTSNDPSYSLAMSTDCGGGSIALANNDAKLCNITYEQYYVPVVTTPTATSIASTTATLGANVTSLGNPASISARGTCWDTTPSPTANCLAEGGTTTGVFTQARTGFTASTTYYYRGYATNSFGTGYSADSTFTTASGTTIPTVTTTAVSSITQTTASSGGNVTSDGGAAVTARGVVWDTSTNPTIALATKTSNGTGTGSFSSSISGLTCGTTYHVRAYATNSIGTAYGDELSFTTNACTGYVVVNKTVVNTGGGTATTATFAPYKVDTTTVTLGASTAFVPGTYTVTETSNINYVTTFSGDCNTAGQITVVANQTKTCQITNTYVTIAGTYTVTAPNSSSYRINGSNDPTLTLQRGERYVFNVNAPGHPFWIKLGQASKVTGTANAYNTGVTNNGIASGTIIFDVPLSAPAADLYYICEIHPNMNGNINTTP